MASDDWYRNKKWNKQIEEHFYLKLGRARSQRDQYLVIQALSLSKTYPEVALRLVDEYFEARKAEFDDVRALLARVGAYLTLGKVEKAVEVYRQILEREQEFPNHLTGAYVDYPYLVATRKIESEYKNAIKVLTENSGRLTFPIDFFKWHASLALINNEPFQAHKALESAQVKMSGFNFHQNVGLVGKEHANTIKKLRKISV